MTYKPDGELRAIFEVAEGEMQKWACDGDPEISHYEADEVLCRLLIFIGADDLVALYRDVPKWYA